MLLDEFAHYVLRRYEAKDTHNNKIQKACIENLIRIRKELDALPLEGRTALTKLFGHKELGVRVMDAVYLLSTMPEKMIPMLQEIEENCYGDEAIDALTALSMYKTGDISG